MLQDTYCTRCFLRKTHDKAHGVVVTVYCNQQR
ncbi:zinc-finger domain-containing protein [Vibrio splendidus]